MRINWSAWTRKWHRWSSAVIALPFLLVLVTGILLQVKKEWSWVQPPTRRGAGKETPEQDALEGMHRTADFMRVPNLPGLVGYEHGTPGILLLPGVVAKTMTGLGWTKATMREFLWQHSRIPAEQLRRAGAPAWIEIDASAVTRESRCRDPWPITARPENFIIVVAGGGHPTNSYWLQGYSPAVVGRPVERPPALDRLLAEAERDLGPR